MSSAGSRPSILKEAEELINGDRAKDYGDVTENFSRIAQMWGAYKGTEFSPHDVAQMMILVKVARQASGYHRDSNVDIAGYAGLDAQVYEGPLEDTTLSAIKFAHAIRITEEVVGDRPLITWQTKITDPDQDLEDWEKVLFGVPRQWKSLVDVPNTVRVVDSDRDVWDYRKDDGWYFHGIEALGCPSAYDGCGPFIEIIGGKVV